MGISGPVIRTPLPGFVVAAGPLLTVTLHPYKLPARAFVADLGEASVDVQNNSVSVKKAAAVSLKFKPQFYLALAV